MKCAKCGTLNVDGARFCMNCSSALTPVPNTSNQQPTQSFQSQPAYEKRPTASAGLNPGVKYGIIAAAVAVLAIVLFFLIKALNPAQQTGTAPVAPNPADVAGQPLKPQNPAQQTSQPAAPDNPAQQTAEPKQYRQDIAAWLEWLRKIEGKRQEIGNRQASEALTIALHGNADLLRSMLDATDPSAADPGVELQTKINEMITRFKTEWDGLIKEYQTTSPPVPQECYELGKQYGQVLVQYPTIINNILRSIANTDANAVRTASNDRKSLSLTIDSVNRLIKPLADMAGIPSFTVEQESAKSPIGGLLGGL